MNSKVFKRAIELSWTILVLYLIIKMCGGNYFSLACTSTFFEKNLWLYAIVCTFTSYILFNLYYLAICEVVHFNKYIHIALIPYFAVITVLKIFVIPPQFVIILDLISNFVLPGIFIYLTHKPSKNQLNKYYRIIPAYVMNCGFQAISIVIRDVAVTVVVTNMLAQLVLSFDVMIMLVLYWLYSVYNKKEVSGMSYVFTFLLGKGEEELKSMLAETEAKLELNPEDAKLKEDKKALLKAIEELK